jgi:hypothetical protein
MTPPFASLLNTTLRHVAQFADRPLHAKSPKAFNYLTARAPLFGLISKPHCLQEYKYWHASVGIVSVER